MEIAMICKAALFLAGLNLTACSIAKFLQPAEIETQPKNNADLEKVQLERTTIEDFVPADANLESKALPPEIFSAELANFLSPEIFSQPDPVRYFLEKSTALQCTDMRLVQRYLSIISTYKRDKLPSRYLPYAAVLGNMFECLFHLQKVRQTIANMQRFANPTYPQLPADLFSSELFELTSDYILSDDRPPLRLMIKVLNTPALKDKVRNFRNELKKAAVKRKVYVFYKTYLVELSEFFGKEYIVRLEASIIKLRDHILQKNSNFL